jgi:hypothetical protein
MSKNQPTQDISDIQLDIEDYLDFRKEIERDAHKQEEKRRQEAASRDRIVNVAMLGNLLLLGSYQLIIISKEIL